MSVIEQPADGVGGDDPDPSVETPPPAPPPAPTPPAAPTPVPIGITSEQLKERLREAETSGEKKFLKSMGFEKPADLKAVLKLVKDQQEADLSEKEKLEKQIAELKPKADKADAYEGLVSTMVDEQFLALPEAARAAIDEVASGNPQERLRMMQVMRKSGLLTQPSTPAGPPARPNPATTSPPPNAPLPKGPRTKWDEFKDIEKKNATLGAIFYERNRVAIDSSKPASQ